LDSDNHWSDQGSVATLMAGPRFKFRQEQFQPFLQGLVGLHRLSIDGLGADNRIGAIVGGGFDIPVKERFAIRLFEADYVWAHHNFFPKVPGTQNLTGARLRAGILLNLLTGPPPAPLAATCAMNPTSVMAGEPVTLTVNATNIPKNHTVTYSYNATGGTSTPKDNATQIDTTGLAPGNYTVTATVTDPKAKKMAPATCNASFTIQEPPKHPPTISCSANPTTVQSGQPIALTCTGSSPDNRPLTYNHTASAGRLTPNGPNATLDTAGLPAGPVSVQSTVTDDRGLSASTSTSATVEVPPPPPQASKLNEIEFKNAKKPARVDNEAKAILDDVALRLQRDADSKAVVVGNFDPSEKKGESIAEQRAVNTKAYLTKEKGIDPARIEVRTGNAGTKTAEIWIVPPGATFSQAGTQTFDEAKVKVGRDAYPQPPKPARKGRTGAKKTAPPPTQ
jgi:outer membrane protein OmpA-like peptidoglycan-associated protein